jgi:phospholipase C
MGVAIRGWGLSLLSAVLLLMLACGGGSRQKIKITQNTPNTPIQHIIILIQENRTPDNLFGSDLVQNQSRRLPNADLVSSGPCHGQSITLTAQPLDSCWDPDHGHSIPHPSWTQMYDGGQMDGACDIFIHTDECTSSSPVPPNPNYSFVDNTPIAATGVGLIEPYYQIASQYGFANYMFQTNQGPSFPAHQFLFTGTSAPVAYNDPGDTQMMWQWFVAENYVSTTTDSYGCNAPSGSFLYEIEPSGTEVPGYIPSGQVAGFPCYEHPTLSDLLDANTPPISWRYYGNMTPDSLWNAPNAINHICMPSGGVCNGPAWTNGSVALQSGQILTDIGNCQLPQVSWIIPDGNWSDHAGTVSTDGGPSWVAAIVNAVGNSWSNSNHKCDYWGTNSNDSTAILITWDDWGGFYDHVSPLSKVGIGYPGAQGYSQQYVYGFRVPLLVVSAYAKQSYTSTLNHDFGSILNFTEYALGENGKSLGEIDPPYHYADYYAQDVGAAPNNYALYDFFNFSQTPLSFTTITGAKYAPICFTSPKSTGCFANYPIDPDNDAKEGED